MHQHKLFKSLHIRWFSGLQFLSFAKLTLVVRLSRKIYQPTCAPSRFQADGQAHHLDVLQTPPTQHIPNQPGLFSQLPLLKQKPQGTSSSLSFLPKPYHPSSPAFSLVYINPLALPTTTLSFHYHLSRILLQVSPPSLQPLLPAITAGIIARKDLWQSNVC